MNGSIYMRAVVIVQLFLILGIVSNFVKEMFFAYSFGSGFDIELFRIAFGIPYALFQTLGTAMVGVLLPVYLSRRAVDGESFSRLADQAQQFQFVVFVFGVLTAPIQATFLAPGYSAELLEKLKIVVVFCWMFFFVVAQTFPTRLYLQANNKKNLIAGTSFVLSIVVVIVIAVISLIYQVLSTWALVFAHVIAGAVLLLVYLIVGRRTGYTERFKLVRFKIYRGDVIYWQIVAAFISIVLFALLRVFDRSFATFMAPGVVANLEYSYNIYTAYGLMIGTAATLILARSIALRFVERAEDSTEKLYWLIKKLFILALVSMVLSILTVLFVDPLVGLVYERGLFSASDGVVVQSILVSLMYALPFMVIGMVLMQVMYAIKAAFLLMLIGLIKIALKYLSMSWLIGFDLSVFGYSNLFVEIVGCASMLGYIVYRERKRHR